MAFVEATVYLARPLIAAIAKFLVLPVWTSVAFKATFFAAAVLTLAEAFRATPFDATVWTQGTIVEYSAVAFGAMQ